MKKQVCHLKPMKNNRNPGSDGFSAEFFLNILEISRSFHCSVNQLWFYQSGIINNTKRGNNHLYTQRQ